MTSDPIEQLPDQLARRNWLILALLLLGTLPFGRMDVSLGVLAGGLIAIGGFYWLRRALNRLLSQPVGGSRFRYQFGYAVRLLALGGLLALLVAVVRIHPGGLVLGLSVVVINLIWLTIQRAFKQGGL